MMKASLLSLPLSIALVLGGCGGGGSISVIVPPSGPESEIEVSVPLSPVYRVFRPNQARDTTSYLGQEDAKDLPFADGRLPYFNPATGPPVIVLEESSESVRRATERAVSAINRGLPDNWQIRVAEKTRPDDSYPVTTPRQDGGITHTLIRGSPDRGVIFLQAAPRTEWEFPAGYENPPTGSSTIGWHTAFNIVSGPEYRYEGGKIWVDGRLTGDDLEKTIAHEIIHVLGRGHVDNSDRPFWSVMQTGRSRNPGDILFPVDWGALQAIYATAQGAIKFDTLESQLAGWDDREYEVSGSFENIDLGVWARYGVPGEMDDLIKPWVSLDLEPSPAFVGSATWTGYLLGMTSDKDAVMGKAEIKLNLGEASLQGRARFAELVSVESGDLWRQGSVSYSIRGEGNRFSELEDKVSGTIYGAEHEAVAGTLRDQGLVAVFGAIK